MLDSRVLRNLAQRLALDASDDHEVQVELALCLVPMIRCALRAGVGVPQVVAWARANAWNGAEGMGMTEDTLTLSLARKLSSFIVKKWYSAWESVRAEDTVRVNNHPGT